MSLDDLPKQYDPRDAQERWYAFWLDRGYFHADPASPKPPYCIVIPPPNVTGALHLGHALNNTIQDILIRWRRMQGFDALWMPGTDHAGIATQAVVETRIRTQEGKTRHDLGRDGLVGRIWAWKDEYEKRILNQLKLMGCSCDWERTRFTLDPICARAVRATFFRLFKAGKIFRGKRLVNWDTQLRTAVADDEIEYQETEGHLWTIAYPIPETGDVLRVATTRPETMLGDTAVAVHPEDDRYRHLIGKTARLPLLDRPIPIIADPILVDPTFGTGCVKVTPAHDPNDYQTGLRHNLPMINLLNPDGTFNENAGPYATLPGREVRKRVVADLEAQGLLIKVEPHTNRVGLSDRSKTPIEPFLSDQWFVRMGEDPDGTPGFAQSAMDAVTSGRVRITPERYARSYLDWLGEKRDWCISRQLWWGHRIPVWSRRQRTDDSSFPGRWTDHIKSQQERMTTTGSAEDLKIVGQYVGSPWTRWGVAHGVRMIEDGFLEEYICVPPRSPQDQADTQEEAELIQQLEQQGFVQDPDVLDTWFSSALWPHSTLGWPEPTAELQKYYPTSVLSTARDIITLWVARMVIFGQFNMGEVPFRDVFIHPVIQDGLGRRMSKTLGNGIDPVDIIDLYGADALRFTLALSTTETQDLRMPVESTKLPDGRTVNTSERFEQGRTFPNKFWNAARFALLNLEGFESGPIDWEALPTEDRWILASLDRLIAETTADLEVFRFAEVTRRLRDFTWYQFCDWYVELIKGRLRDESSRPTAQRVLASALDAICRLLHPIMPFVTEQVWQALGRVAPERGFPEPRTAAESVCIAPWPTPIGVADPASEAAVGRWQAAIEALRNLRAEHNIPRSARIAPILKAGGPVAADLQRGSELIRALTAAESISIAGAADRPGESAVAVLPEFEIIVPLAGLIDTGAEAARLRKGLAEIDRQLGPIRAKLRNESFVARAPAEVVAQQRARLAELEAQQSALAARLGELGGPSAR